MLIPRAKKLLGQLYMRISQEVSLQYYVFFNYFYLILQHDGATEISRDNKTI